MIPDQSSSYSESGEDLQHQKHGRWEPEECQSFIKCTIFCSIVYDVYGDNWKEISREIGTRTAEQVRSHAQKYFIKVEREKQKQRRKECQKKNLPNEIDHKLRPRHNKKTYDGFYTNMKRKEF